MNHLHEVTTTNSKHHKVKDYYLLLLLKFLTGIGRSAILLELQEDDYYFFSAMHVNLQIYFILPKSNINVK